MTMQLVDEPMEVERKPSTKSQRYDRRTARPIEIVRKFASPRTSINVDPEFYQLVNVWKQVGHWEGDQISEFIVQFFDGPHLFNAKTKDMVRASCDLKWHLIPASARTDFTRFLCNVASLNPMHCDSVLRSCIRNCLHNCFAPPNKEGPPAEANQQLTTGTCEEQFSDEERESILKLGLEAIEYLLPPSFPDLRLLVSQMEKCKVHKSAPVNDLLSYVRLSIMLSDRYQRIASELWSFIVDCLLKLDGEVSQGMTWSCLNDVRQIFPKADDHITGPQEESASGLREKLDACMITILCYSSLGSENAPIKPTDYEFTKWMINWTPSGDLFSRLAMPLESQVLFVHEIENTPFIWFYMCSQNEETMKRFLDHLWKIIKAPVLTPNDWKKVHNAVAFMAGLLSRAEFVDITTASDWLKRMIDWCVEYVNRAGHVKSGGGIQHGTFYATVESAFFILCFRYKEFIEQKMANQIRLWGIARIVHSQLEPLSFIARPLALFFASVSRYMQIVYCSHIISMAGERSPIETYFPFLRFGLAESGKFIQPLLRNFVPVEDDFDTIQTMRSRRTTEVTEPEDDYDFMMADDGIDVDYEFEASIGTA